jgi:hypothetical protein
MLDAAMKVENNGSRCQIRKGFILDFHLKLYEEQ